MASELTILALGPKGDGVHHSDRGPVFVERALPGDRVQAKIRRGDDGVLRGDLLDVVAASPHRVAAPCRHYDACGGCTLQHAGDDFYKEWKVDVVRTALEKRGVRPDEWRSPVFLPAGHRRRVTFAAFKKKNTVTLGYFRRRSHQVTDISTCLTADPAIMDLRSKLATALVPILQDGKAVDVFIQMVEGQAEIVVTGPVGKKGMPDLTVHEGVAQLAHGSNIARISWRPRERDAAEVMLEIRPLLATFCALTVSLPPLTFLQPTKAGEAALIGAVMDNLPQNGRFADLFSGCGTFTGPMLTRGPVDAFEAEELSVHALDKARGTLPLNATQRDLFRRPLQPEEVARYDCIVFDPPRAGAQEQAKTLAQSKVHRLIGVSCNPATFARDARILIDGGYSLRSVQVIDQFTWSHHVELVGVFERRPS